MRFKTRAIQPNHSLVASLPRFRKPFRKFGEKQLFLPTCMIAMHRTPHLGPGWAKFSVPLWFSKLDLRDYLHHVYNVNVGAIKSYVKLGAVVQGDRYSGSERYAKPQPNRWHRKRSSKTMTAELEEAFVWPTMKEVTDENGDDPWDQAHAKERAAEGKKFNEATGRLADAYVDEENRELTREQYEKLISGERTWEAPKSDGPVILT